MRVEELKIGNYVRYNNNKQPLVISLEEFSDLYIEGNELQYYKPIPLTEEWFIKFGFKKVGVNFEREWFIIWAWTKEYKFIFRHDGNSHHIQYVHQLQNLYFALTGKELTI